jgi:hypothetical protein
MKEEDVLFLTNAIVMVNTKEFRIKEENVAKLIELADTYGIDVLDAKIQQIKEILNGQ